MKIELLGRHPEWTRTVADWLFSQFAHLEEDIGSAEVIVERLYKQQGFRGCPVTFIGLHQGYPIGTASLVEHDGIQACSSYSPWLADVYVDPTYREQGTGALLVRSVIEYARQEGYRKCYLYTENQQAFFSRLGWLELAKILHHGVSVSIMEQALR